MFWDETEGRVRHWIGSKGVCSPEQVAAARTLMEGFKKPKLSYACADADDETDEQ